MVIRRPKQSKRKCECGKEFTPANVEQFECEDCFLKGKTYIKFRGDI